MGRSQEIFKNRRNIIRTVLLTTVLPVFAAGCTKVGFNLDPASTQAISALCGLNESANSNGPRITSPPRDQFVSGSILLEGTCPGASDVRISGGGLPAPVATACRDGQFRQTLILTSGDGLKDIRVSQDGVVDEGYSCVYLDTAPPNVLITTPANDHLNSTVVSVSGTCESGLPVELTSNSSATVTTDCAGGKFLARVPTTGGDGPKEIVATQRDPAGNTGRDEQIYIIDTVAPRVTIESPLANAIVRNQFQVAGRCESGLNVELTGTAVEIPVSTLCTNGAYSATVIVSNRDGVFYVTASQTDLAGNRGWDQRNVVRDTTPPTITITAPAAGTASATGLALAGLCTDGLPVEISGTGLSAPQTVSCAGGSFGAVITFSAGDGVKSIIASQTDRAGNRGADSRDFLRDSTPPLIRITAPAAGTATRSSITLTGVCESGLDVEISGDVSSSRTACAGGQFTANLNLTGADGAKTIAVAQTDAVGNQGRDSRPFVLDSTPPEIRITAPAAGSVTRSALTISGVCVTGLEVQISGDLRSPNATSCVNGQFSFLAEFSTGDGAKSVQVAQTDSAGNTGRDSRAFALDTEPPSIKIIAPAAGTPAREGLLVTGTCTSGLPVELTGDVLASAVSPCQNGAFEVNVRFSSGDGGKNIVASQTDSAGNTGSDSRTFVRLNVGPAIRITAPAAGTATRLGLTILGTCTDSWPVLVGGDLEAQVTTPCVQGQFSAEVRLQSPDGAKTVSASQTDAIGNAGIDSRAFVLKATNPEIRISSPAANSYTRGSLTLNGSCTSNLAVQVGGDASPVETACTAGQFTTEVTLSTGDGTKTVRVSQTDEVGNTGADQRAFLLDTMAPRVQFTAPSEGLLVQSGLTARGQCETGLAVSLSGTGVASAITVPCVNGQFEHNLILPPGDGPKTLVAAQTDLAGNTGSDQRNVIRDTTPPSITITSPASGTATRGELQIAGQCTDGLPVQISGAVSPSLAVCVGGLWSALVTLLPPDGAKTVVAAQTDSAGNTGSDSRVFTLKTSSPSIRITSPAENSVTQSGLNLAGTCTTGLAVEIGGGASGSTPCVNGAFSMPITLSGPDGAKTVSVSQTDSAGNTGRDNRTFLLDTTAPMVRITAPTEGALAGAAITVTGSCESGLPVRLSGSGLAAEGPVSCVSGVFNATVTLSHGDGLKNIIASQTDSAGNTGRDSRNVLRDTTPPAVRIETPLANAVTNSGLTVTGTCESGLDVILTGDLPAPITTSCASGQFSQMLTLSGADGVKVVTATQADTTGNSGRDARNFILDQTPPMVTIAAPAQGSALIGAFTLSGSCEAGLALEITGDLSAAKVSMCPTSGQYTEALTVSPGTGPKRVFVAQVDLAGNRGSASANYVVTPKPTATETFLADQGEGKVDILFVNDNSASMDPEQAALGQKFPSFVEELRGLDWHVGITTTDCSTGKWGICGSLLNMTGTSSFILNPNITGFDQVFNNTIQRPETLNCAARGECPSGLEEPLKASMAAIDKRLSQNVGFFRDGAALAIVILTDEDEQSNGPATATKPQAVVDKVAAAFGANKKFKSYAITVLNGDSACLKQQQDQQGGIGAYGTFPMALASLTGGQSVSICAPDYSVTLKQIGQDLRKLTQAVKLSREPAPGSVRVTFRPVQTVNWHVSGDTVLFDRPVSAGTEITVTYEY